MASQFQKLLREAIADFMEHGFDSEGRLQMWTNLLRQSAVAYMGPVGDVDQLVAQHLNNVFRRQVVRKGYMKHHKGISLFTIQRIQPALRSELDRRIMASANLIKLNRSQAIETTMRRFQGWATSIPAGGTKAQSATEEGEHIRKALASLSFTERRVAIDQGHKLASAIDDVIAKQGGAIAMIWHSQWRQANYNYREDHKERDEKVYLIRDSWAHEKGFVKTGAAGYLDKITQPGEEVFCRCKGQYIYNLRSLPPEMLTNKGRSALDEARGKLASLR